MNTYLGRFVVFYLDDILIFSKAKEENLAHIRQVLQRLNQEKLLVNLHKCSFMKEGSVYLGFVISYQGLEMNHGKVKSSL